MFVIMSGVLLLLAVAGSHPCNGNAPAREKRRITAVLFDLREDEVDHLTNHDYNGYGCHPELAEELPGYKGGHSGWDVQTNSDHDPDRNDRFYSLTAGKVIRADNGDSDELSVIAVYNEAYDLTTFYLHARRVDVDVLDRVEVGDRLGRQGNTRLEKDDEKTNSHVHVEVREKEWVHPSDGIDDAEKKGSRNQNPIPILFKMLHDVNQDRRVDNTDAWLVFRHRGFHANDLRKYDINNDSVIDMTDVRLVWENREIQLAAPRRSERPTKRLRGNITAAGKVTTTWGDLKTQSFA